MVTVVWVHLQRQPINKKEVTTVDECLWAIDNHLKLCIIDTLAE